MAQKPSLRLRLRHPYQLRSHSLISGKDKAANGLYLDSKPRKKCNNIYLPISCAQINGLNYNIQVQNYGTENMVRRGLFSENIISFETDKIFCSDWLSDRSVVLGTKCNNLIVYDVVSSDIITIPTLGSGSNHIPLQNTCGIHALKVNPSRTLLATGGEVSNTTAVYSLPEISPLCVGDGAHRDWIFDIQWLDDEFFVTGARDNTIALWQVNNSNFESHNEPHYHYLKSTLLKTCKRSQKVRALALRHESDLAAISLNAFIHSFDLKTFRQKTSYKLPHCEENVCLLHDNERKMYAVGSQSHVTLIDSSTMNIINDMSTVQYKCCVRSLSCRGNILTVGTAMGWLCFYDIRVGKCMRIFISSNGKFFMNGPVRYTLETFPALFTHSLDFSGTRIFTGGGPLSVEVIGSYAAIWQ